MLNLKTAQGNVDLHLVEGHSAELDWITHLFIEKTSATALKTVEVEVEVNGAVVAQKRLETDI